MVVSYTLTVWAIYEHVYGLTAFAFADFRPAILRNISAVPIRALAICNHLKEAVYYHRTTGSGRVHCEEVPIPNIPDPRTREPQIVVTGK